MVLFARGRPVWGQVQIYIGIAAMILLGVTRAHNKKVHHLLAMINQVMAVSVPRRMCATISGRQ